MTLLLVLFISTAIMNLLQAQQAIMLDQIDCSPQTHYVTVDRNYNAWPRVVYLPRCFGKNDNRKTTRCVPKEVTNITIYTMENALPKLVTLTKPKTCHEVCTIEASSCNQNQMFNGKSCSCDCKFIKNPGVCTAPFYWDVTHCGCKCPHTANSMQCGSKKEFDTLACGCVCQAKHFRRCSRKKMYLDTNTCLCTDVAPVLTGKAIGDCSKTKGVSTTVVILVIVFEALAFVVVYYLINKYCFKKVRQIFKFSDKGYENNSDVVPRVESDTINQQVNHDIRYSKGVSKENLLCEEMGTNSLTPKKQNLKKHNSMAQVVDEGFYESVDNNVQTPTFKISDNYASVTQV